MGLRAVRQARHQTSGGPHQDVCRVSLAIREPGGFKHWTDLSPLAIAKHQIAKTVVEVHMVAASHAAQSMAAFAIRRFTAEAARPTATHIGSQATS